MPDLNVKNFLLDVIVVSADLPTLLGVATGIALLTGLLCFVLRLFSGNRYPATRHYGNANLAPPLLYSSDNQWINGEREYKEFQTVETDHSVLIARKRGIKN